MAKPVLAAPKAPIWVINFLLDDFIPMVFWVFSFENVFQKKFQNGLYLSNLSPKLILFRSVSW
jgi:hypothetical protein